jgi:hypothetical protein
MKALIRVLLKSLGLLAPLEKWILQRQLKQDVVEWERNGRPAPPPHLIKQRAIRHYAEQFGLQTLVETGTYLGDMVEAMKHVFQKIYSIELSQELYEKAQQRFAGQGSIHLIQGDSGVELGKLMDQIDQPTLFWLDGHYSAGITAKGEKDTPIYEELSHVFGLPQKGHVILIDDARCFGKDPAYPSLEEMTEFIRSKRPDAGIEVKDDSIRITPGANG